jgi:heme/copper-type cytochrome/quinol oxidase subunit 2
MNSELSILAQRFRKLPIPVAIALCVFVAFSHFYASMKASCGISSFLVVNPETERAFQVWSFVSNHLWMAVLYFIIVIGLSFTFSRKFSPVTLSAWCIFSFLFVLGIWYLDLTAYLGGKFLNYTR